MHVRFDALNFFLADVRGGLGAFVSVFLVTSAGWTPAEVGAVLTVSGLLGIALLTPVGMAIDATSAKRGLLAAAVVLLAMCAVAIARHPTGPVVLAADITMAVLGGVFAPVVAALTLGLFREHELALRFARNAAWDRVGNVVIAAVVGVVGWRWGQQAPFFLVPAFAIVTIALVMSIPAGQINHARARGLAVREAGAMRQTGAGRQTGDEPQGLLRVLAGNRPLLILSAVAATFHFANAAMLPLVGQKLALAHPGYETALTSACILIAQGTAIPVAILVGARADRWGLRLLLIVACGALVARGLVFAATDRAGLLLAAQMFDGVAAGIWDVLVPLALAQFVAGTGRYSASRGVLGTVQGIGGSLSNGAAGAMVAFGGYSAGLLMLAAVAAVAAVMVTLLPATAAAPVATAPRPLTGDAA